MMAPAARQVARARLAAYARSGAWGRPLLIGLACAYAGALVVLPIGALVGAALARGLGPLLRTFSDPAVAGACLLTLRISLLAALVNGVGGLVVAWVLAREPFWGRRVVNALIDLPFAVSPVIAGFMLVLLFGRLGPLAGLEDALGLRIVFATPGMVLATIFVTFPLMIRELQPVIAGLDHEQEHAAATLGARRWQTFRFVSLPVLRWALVYGEALTFARALGEFGAVLVVGGDVQGQTETLPLYIFRALANRDDASAYTLALLLGGVSLALVLVIERLHARSAR